MDWLSLLKIWKFNTHLESLSEIVYKGYLDKKDIISEMNKFINKILIEFVITIEQHDDQPIILELPSQIDKFKNAIELTDDINLEIEIRINKINFPLGTKTENCNLIYYSNQSQLIKEFNKNNLTSLISNVFKESTPTIIYLFDEEGKAIDNGYIYIKFMNDFNLDIIHNNNLIKNSILSLMDDNVRWNDERSSIPPDFLYFKSSNLELTNFFNSWAAKLIVAFLAVKTEFRNGEYISTFIGFRKVSFKLLIPDDCNQFTIDELYKLYKWAYSEKTTDKISLIQNIVSLNIKNDLSENLFPLFDNIKQIRDSVQNNYQVYIQDSVKTYLDERKQTEDFIKNTNIVISQHINSLTDLLSKNLIGILVAAITAIIGLAKNTNTNVLYIVLYIYAGFVLVFTFYYGFFSLISVLNLNFDYKNRMKVYKKRFIEEDLTKLAKSSLNRQFAIFYFYFIFSILLNVCLAFSAILFSLYVQGYASPYLDNISDFLAYLQEGILKILKANK